MTDTTTEHPTEDERIGETLRVLRERRGYNRTQLAELMGISRPQLSNIEAGRRKLDEVNLARAADALEVRPLAIRRPDIPIADDLDS